MKITFLQQLIILLLVIASEGIFFHNRKKSLWDLFSKGKDQKKDVHHFHLHYFHLPIKVANLPISAPQKRTLDHLHDEKLKSLGWTEEEYNIPDPKIIYPTKLDSIWDDHSLPYTWSNPLFESSPHKEGSDLYIHVPLHQEIVLQLPKEKEETSFLGSLLKKIHALKKLLFSGKSEHENDGWEDRSDKKLFSNDINDYIYIINKKEDKVS